jgi:hypothetical protein
LHQLTLSQASASQRALSNEQTMESVEWSYTRTEELPRIAAIQIIARFCHSLALNSLSLKNSRL